jgi:aspartate kinase
MRTHTGVAQRMFKALADAGVNIQNITTSEIKISCIIDKEQAAKALQIVHDAFELGGAR